MDHPIEKIDPPKFFCHARWRCRRCGSPWFGATTVQKARRLLEAHLRGGCER